MSATVRRTAGRTQHNGPHSGQADLQTLGFWQGVNQPSDHLQWEDVGVGLIETLEVLQGIEALAGHGVHQAAHVVVPMRHERLRDKRDLTRPLK